MRAVIALAAAALATAGLSVPLTTAQAAPAGTVKVCVNKKSGKATQLRKGKCRKGWKKVSWSSQGPTGIPGVPGNRGGSGSLSLYANGQRIGPALGSVTPELYFPMVLIDGGAYGYLQDGTLYPNVESPSYVNSDCSGTASFISPTEIEARLLASWAGSSVRLVARTTSPQLGPVQGVWVPNGEVAELPAAGQNMYRRLATGVCSGAALETGWLTTVTPVTAPPNLTPPLTIR